MGILSKHIQSAKEKIKKAPPNRRWNQAVWIEDIQDFIRDSYFENGITTYSGLVSRFGNDVLSEKGKKSLFQREWTDDDSILTQDLDFAILMMKQDNEFICLDGDNFELK